MSLNETMPSTRLLPASTTTSRLTPESNIWQHKNFRMTIFKMKSMDIGKTKKINAKSRIQMKTEK